MVTSSGDVVTAARGGPDFEGLVVGLGALGVLTRLTLDVEPAYDVRQRVFEDLAWDRLFEHFDEITAGGSSVSVLTRWGGTVEQVWVKSRVTDAPETLRHDLFGARPATVDRHWLQSEYLVPREHAVAAIQAVRAQADRIRPLLQVCEIRTVAADRLWMSPQYRRDTVGIHFTWMLEPAAVVRVLTDLEPALAPFAARPHWGKLFLADAATLAARYERLPDFARLVESYDPRGAFRNAWLEARVLGRR